MSYRYEPSGRQAIVGLLQLERVSLDTSVQESPSVIYVQLLRVIEIVRSLGRRDRGSYRESIRPLNSSTREYWIGDE